MSSTGRAERLDVVCGADELRHDDKATEHEHHVEDPRAETAEVEQGGDGPGAGERSAEHLRADQDGRADNGNDVKPDDAAALGHSGLPLAERNVPESGCEIKSIRQLAITRLSRVDVAAKGQRTRRRKRRDARSSAPRRCRDGNNVASGSRVSQAMRTS